MYIKIPINRHLRILFVHTNFPGQFRNLAFAAQAHGHDVHALAPSNVHPTPGITTTQCVAYRKPPLPPDNILTSRFEADTVRSLNAFNAAKAMAASGYVPDVIIGHPSFGEMTLLGLVWPDARRLVYAENFVSAQHMSGKFDPEFPPPSDLEQAYAELQMSNSGLAMARAHALVSPTEHQRSKFPNQLRDSIHVIPDGIDTEAVRPRPDVAFAIPNTAIVLRPGDEVVTYVNRYLEPLRGIHVFLRTLVKVLDRNPNARALIVGASQARIYGRAAPAGQTWIDIFWKEVQERIDVRRVHFLGRIERSQYLDVLAVSAAHVYLTYPFVLSWSLLESMSAGCAIIASSTAPVQEFIKDGQNGRLVDFFDTEAQANAITEALKNPSAFADLRAKARADAISRWDFQTVALPAWLKLIEA